MKCGHKWKVTKEIDIVPNCSIIDCYVKCSLCKKEGTATIHLENNIEK